MKPVFMNPKYRLLILFLVFTTNWLIAKNLPKSIDVPVKLGKMDQRKLDKATEKLIKARAMWKQLNTQYNPDSATNYKTDSVYNSQAMPLLQKTAELFGEANSMMYEVYHKNCIDFWYKHKYDHPSGLENAKNFQSQAFNYIQKAQLNRKAAEDNFQNQYVKAYDRYFEAISLEIIAVKKEGRALQIYSDWPVHYPYQFDEDIEQDLFHPKVYVKNTPAAPKETPGTISSKPDTLETEPTVLLPDVIYFSVQIAAHTVPIPEKVIRESIYHGPMKITQIREDGWYKYILGHYKSYQVAERLLNKVNVPKAFVVAYKNGKRVPLNEVNAQ